MVFRSNEKDYRWTASYGYNLKQFMNKTKLHLPVRVALLFIGKEFPGTRPMILKTLGDDRSKVAGHLTGLFAVMTQNSILKYSKKDKSYIRGRRYKEFLEDVEKQLLDKRLSTLYKKEYMILLRETSQSIHFIKED